MAYHNAGQVGNTPASNALVTTPPAGKRLRALWLTLTNRSAAAAFVHLYDAAAAGDVTPGTDRVQPYPIALPAGAGPVTVPLDLDVLFANGIVVLASDDTAGTGSDPATLTDVDVAFEAVK